MAQQNKMKTSTRIPSSRRRTQRITTLEQFPTEIFFEIFDYLTGNQIYISFFGLNRRINRLVYNTPNVHLDLSQTTTKFYHNFQRTFCEQNFVSIVLSADYANILQRLLNISGGRRLNSISLMDLPIYTFQTKLPEILSIFRHQLVSLKMKLTGRASYETEDGVAKSFAYLLTEFPLLKYLTLSGNKNIDLMTNRDMAVINNTVISLTISSLDRERWIPLLYRFEKLKKLTVDFHSISSKRRATSEEDDEYYVSQIHEKLPIDYTFRLRQIQIHRFDMTLENVEQLFKVFTSSTLLTLSLINCQRPRTRHPLPRRQPPFLDGTKWHELVKNYLPSTMKRFYIEYEDVDNTMCMTNRVQVKEKFMKYSGQSLPWKVSVSYNKTTKFLSFDFIFI